MVILECGYKGNENEDGLKWERGRLLYAIISWRHHAINILKQIAVKISYVVAVRLIEVSRTRTVGPSPQKGWGGGMAPNHLQSHDFHAVLVPTISEDCSDLPLPPSPTFQSQKRLEGNEIRLWAYSISFFQILLVSRIDLNKKWMLSYRFWYDS